MWVYKSYESRIFSNNSNDTWICELHGIKLRNGFYFLVLLFVYMTPCALPPIIITTPSFFFFSHSLLPDFHLILKSKLNQLAHAHIFCFVLLDKLGRYNILTSFLKVHPPPTKKTSLMITINCKLTRYQ